MSNEEDRYNFNLFTLPLLSVGGLKVFLFGLFIYCLGMTLGVEVTRSAAGSHYQTQAVQSASGSSPVVITYPEWYYLTGKLTVALLVIGVLSFALLTYIELATKQTEDSE